LTASGCTLAPLRLRQDDEGNADGKRKAWVVWARQRRRKARARRRGARMLLLAIAAGWGGVCFACLLGCSPSDGLGFQGLDQYRYLPVNIV